MGTGFSGHILAGRRHGEAAMFDAFGGDKAVRQSANPQRIAANRDDFEAVVVIEMNVKRGNDEIGVIVLQIGQ
jgi:hypothetical protein